MGPPQPASLMSVVIEESGKILCGVPGHPGLHLDLRPDSNFLHLPALAEKERVKAILSRCLRVGAPEKLDRVEMANAGMVDLQFLPIVAAPGSARLCTVILKVKDPLALPAPTSRCNSDAAVSFHIESSARAQEQHEGVPEHRAVQLNHGDGPEQWQSVLAVPNRSNSSLQYSDSAPSIKGYDVESQTDLVWSEAGFRCTRCAKPPLPPSTHSVILKHRQSQRARSKRHPSKLSEVKLPIEGHWTITEQCQEEAPERWHSLNICGFRCGDSRGSFHYLQIHGEIICLRNGQLRLKSGTLKWRRSKELQLTYTRTTFRSTGEMMSPRSQTRVSASSGDGLSVGSGSGHELEDEQVQSDLSNFEWLNIEASSSRRVQSCPDLAGARRRE